MKLKFPIKLLLGLLFFAAFAFISPVKAYASSFGSYNPNFAQSRWDAVNRTHINSALNGVTIDIVSSAADNTNYKWSSSSYGCMGCRTCAIKGGAQVDGNDCNGSGWGGSKKTTLSGSGIEFTEIFACGASHAKCGVANDCNPFKVTMTANVSYQGYWTIKGTDSNFYRIGEDGDKTVTTNVQISNDSTTYGTYRFVEVPYTNDHAASIKVYPARINGSTIEFKPEYSHQLAIGETDKRNYQWIWRTKAKLTDTWGALQYGERLKPGTYPTTKSFSTAGFYEVWLAACDPGSNSQSTCDWIDPFPAGYTGDRNVAAGVDYETKLKVVAGGTIPSTNYKLAEGYSRDYGLLSKTIKVAAHTVGELPAPSCRISPNDGEVPLTVTATVTGMSNFDLNMGDGINLLGRTTNEVSYTYGTSGSYAVQYRRGGTTTWGACDPVTVTVRNPIIDDPGEVTP